MRPTILLLTGMLIHVLACAGLSAQYQSPAAVQLPWNGYTVERFPQGPFQSIGVITNRIPGSDISSTAKIFPITLPFDFYFIDTVYKTGTKLMASIDGFISFNGSHDLSSFRAYLPYVPDSDTHHPHNNRLIMAYWYDFRTTGGSDGIYTAIDGPDGDRVLTIEWRVHRSSPPTTPPGAFQVKLFEKSGTIEMNYGDSSIDLAIPQGYNTFVHYGAPVGIKNYGQDGGNPLLNQILPEYSDNIKLLLIANPARLPDTAAITRLPTMRIESKNFVPEWDAAAPFAANGRQPSRYFHYGFPTTAPGVRCGYRIINDGSRTTVPVRPDHPPIDATQGSKGVGTIGGPPAPNFGAFRRPGLFTPIEMVVLNDGGTATGATGITGIVLRNNHRETIATVTGSRGRIEPGDTASVKLTPQPGSFLSKPGLYRIVFDSRNAGLVGAPADFYFHIQAERDMMPVASSSPHSPSLTVDYYRVDSGVVPRITLKNSGTKNAANVKAGYRILNARGVVVKSAIQPTPGIWRPGESREVRFTIWRPPAPGRYRFEPFSVLAGDEIRDNDTLGRISQAIYFDVFATHDVLVCNPAVFGSTPSPHASYPQAMNLKGIPVHIALTNNGGGTQRNVAVRVVIEQDAGHSVYDRTVTLAGITGFGRTLFVDFPMFVPHAKGRYRIRVNAPVTGDAFPGNNTAEWNFDVTDLTPYSRF